MVDSILLVDDDETVNFLNKIIIDKSGLANRVLIAESSNEAIEILKDLLLQGNWPDIILVDINMPGTNGWGFIEEMESSFYKIKNKYSVLMLSSSLDPRDSERVESSNYIKSLESKPLTFETFGQICQRHLEDIR